MHDLKGRSRLRRGSPERMDRGFSSGLERLAAKACAVGDNGMGSWFDASSTSMEGGDYVLAKGKSSVGVGFMVMADECWRLGR